MNGVNARIVTAPMKVIQTLSGMIGWLAVFTGGGGIDDWRLPTGSPGGGSGGTLRAPIPVDGRELFNQRAELTYYGIGHGNI